MSFDAPSDARDSRTFWAITKSAQGKSTNVTASVGATPVQLLVQIQLIKTTNLTASSRTSCL